MITCPFCNTAQVANTVFCNECGQYLLKGEDRDTETLQTGEISWSGYAQNNGKKPAPLSTPIEATALQFIIADQQRVIEVTLEQEITIGRIDPATTVFPTIDLSSLGAAAKSISRRHARIIKRDSEIVLEDLASVNGTFINGKKLTPFLPVRLNNGDVLQLGKVSLAVAIGGE